MNYQPVSTNSYTVYLIRPNPDPTNRVVDLSITQTRDIFAPPLYMYSVVSGCEAGSLLGAGTSGGCYTTVYRCVTIYCICACLWKDRNIAEFWNNSWTIVVPGATTFFDYKRCQDFWFPIFHICFHLVGWKQLLIPRFRFLIIFWITGFSLSHN